MAVIGTSWASGSWVNGQVWATGAWATGAWVEGPVWIEGSFDGWKRYAWGTRGWGEGGWLDGSWADKEEPLVPTAVRQKKYGGAGGAFTPVVDGRGKWDQVRKKIRREDGELLEILQIICASGVLDE